jgi:hypothetical protein
MATPCSVKTQGAKRRTPRLDVGIAIRDLNTATPELVGIRQEHEFMHLFAAPPCAHPGCALPVNGQEPGLSPPHIAIAAECAAIEHCRATTTLRIPNRFITNDSRLRRTCAAR